MSPADILRAAKAKIEDPHHWCREKYAKDGPHGTQRCAEGAMFGFGMEDGANEAWGHLRRAALDTLRAHRLRFFMRQRDIQDVNDQYGHATVLAMFDKAIALAEQEAPQ